MKIHYLSPLVLIAGMASAQSVPPAASTNTAIVESIPAQKESVSAAEIAAQARAAADAARSGARLHADPLLRAGAYAAHLEYLSAPAPQVAVHEADSELFVVIDGSGTMTIGGTLVNPVRDGTNLSAATAVGGTPHKIARGDMLLVPVNTAHSVTQVDGSLVLITMHLPLSGAATSDSNPMALAPDHVSLSVADLPKMEAWYSKVFGIRNVHRFTRDGFQADHMSFGTSLRDFHLDLVWDKNSARPELPRSVQVPKSVPGESDEAAGVIRQGWVHVVFKTAAIDAAYQRLLQMGTDVRADKNQKGLVWRLYFHDPEGNNLQINHLDAEARAF